MWFIIAPILATVISLLGSWLLTQKNIKGWYIQILGTLVWTAYGITLLQPSMAMACLVYLPIEIYGIYTWNKNEQS